MRDVLQPENRESIVEFHIVVCASKASLFGTQWSGELPAVLQSLGIPSRVASVKTCIATGEYLKPLASELLD